MIFYIILNLVILFIKQHLPNWLKLLIKNIPSTLLRVHFRTYAVTAYLFTFQAFLMPLCSQNALISMKCVSPDFCVSFDYAQPTQNNPLNCYSKTTPKLPSTVTAVSGLFIPCCANKFSVTLLKDTVRAVALNVTPVHAVLSHAYSKR